MKGTRTVLLSLVLMLAVALPEASAFCNGDYTNRYPVTYSSTWGSGILVNETGGINFGDGKQIIWCQNGTNYLCYDNSTAYDCYYDDTVMDMWVENGNGTNRGNPFKYWGEVVVVKYNGTTFYDLSPNHYAITPGGTPTLVQGQVGYGMHYDGSGDFHNLGNIQEGADMSIIFWVDVGATDYNYPLGAGDSGNPRWWMEYGVGKEPVLRFYDAGGDHIEPASTVGLTPGTWGHVAGNITATTGYVFTNGIATASQTLGAFTMADTSHDFSIGQALTAAGYDSNSSLDEVYIFNRTLTGSEIKFHKNMTAGDGVVVIGASESSVVSNITVTIDLPSSITYYSGNLLLNFSATSGQATFSVNASVNGTLIYSDDSYANDTTVSQSLLGYLGHGTQTVTACANTSTESKCSTVNPYIWHGINATVVEANGTLVSCYNLITTNGTTNTTFSCRNVSILLEWDDLPYGSTNITANDTVYDNESYAFTVSESMGLVNHTFTLYRIQYFHAVSGGSPIGPFVVMRL